ncbi:hypothetical protein E9993_05405 [Labilibacter sediminis]|nr:hypothetical protein E9993_05405 [Labilibacter sediminis]
MRFISILFVVLVLGCSSGRNKISISTLKLNCQHLSSQISIDKPYFDSIQAIISTYNSDLFIFKQTQFSSNCTQVIEDKGYRFIPVYSTEDDSSVVSAPIIIKTSSIEVLGRSYFIYTEDFLLEEKNIVEWFKLKSKSTGHIFYLFNIQLQDSLTPYLNKKIAYSLLKRIDNVSAGLPVIVLGDFIYENSEISKVMTGDWVNVFPLKEIKSGVSSDFLVNDFFKVIRSNRKQTNDSLVNNMVVKFLLNTQKINKSTDGGVIPEM